MTDMSKELKALKLAHAVEKQIMQDNFTQCKTAAEYLKTENDNLRCCGNCKKHHEDRNAVRMDRCNSRRWGYYCDHYQTDGLTRAEREGK